MFKVHITTTLQYSKLLQTWDCLEVPIRASPKLFNLKQNILSWIEWFIKMFHFLHLIFTLSLFLSLFKKNYQHPNILPKPFYNPLLLNINIYFFYNQISIVHIILPKHTIYLTKFRHAESSNPIRCRRSRTHNLTNSQVPNKPTTFTHSVYAACYLR